MRSTCPTCETAYTIPDDRIGAKGRKVRCTKCGDEWRVMQATEVEPPPRPAPLSPPAPAPAPVAPPVEVDPFDVADIGFDAAPTDTAAVDPFAAAAMPSTAADEAPGVVTTAAPHPPEPPIRRVHIRTKRRFPKIGRAALAAVTSRLAPAVGPAVFLAACLVVAGVYVFRAPIVAVAPDLAGLYSALGAPVNLRGLEFGRIETLREIDNGQPVLVVEGSISNVTKQLREVPSLRFALRGADTQELYAWSIDPRSTAIESGDTIRFRTRLAAPPELATEVQVRFVERRSQHAGLP